MRATLSNGMEINIEMQNNPDDYSEQRCLYYWSKIYSNSLKKGKKYTDLKKTICIWFLNEDVYKDIKSFETKWKIRCENEETSNYFDYMQFHIIELQKFRKDDTIKPSKKNFWLWFLDHTNGEMIKLACSNYEQIKKAREELDKLTADPAIRNELIRQEIAEYDENTRIANAIERGIEQGIEQGRAEGKAEGRIAGIEEEKIKIAKNMLAQNISIELIEKCTGLTKKEIEEISHKISKG